MKKSWREYSDNVKTFLKYYKWNIFYFFFKCLQHNSFDWNFWIWKHTRTQTHTFWTTNQLRNFHRMFQLGLSMEEFPALFFYDCLFSPVNQNYLPCSNAANILRLLQMKERTVIIFLPPSLPMLHRDNAWLSSKPCGEGLRKATLQNRTLGKEALIWKGK